MFWIRPLVRGESKEAFTAKTITISTAGEKEVRRSKLALFSPTEIGGFKPEDLDD